MGAAQEKPARKPRSTITLSAPQSEIELGSPVPLTLSLTNISDHDLRFGVETIPGPVFKNEKGRQMDIRVRDSNGKPVTETEYGKTIHGRSVAPPPTVGPGSGAARSSWFFTQGIHSSRSPTSTKSST